MGGGGQGGVVVPADPAASFEMVKSDTGFQFPVVVFDAPADLALDQACRRVVSTGLKGKGLTLPGFATPTQPSGKGLCGEEDIA